MRVAKDSQVTTADVIGAPPAGHAAGLSRGTWPWSLDPRIVASQKAEDTIAVFFPRKLSKYITAICLPLGLSANQATALWGVLSVATSVVIYQAMLGQWWLVPVVFAMYVFAEVIDCADGEIARVRRTANPIGGKLLDGICHKATEFSILVAFVAAAYVQRPSFAVVLIGLVLFAGEAMCGYSAERRVLVIRLHAKPQRFITEPGPYDLYRLGETWASMPRPKKLKTLTGLLHYKSIYPMIALSLVSADALVAGLAVLAHYKHYTWLRQVSSMVNNPPPLKEA
jgi:phosphatidylglycerophosphate synthase